MDTSRRLRRAFALLLSASLLAITAGAVSAAAKPKIDVCHFDQRLGTYTLTTIPSSSLAKHLAHGDGLPGEGAFDENCQPVPPAPRVFAVAFSDTNGNHAFETGTDRLIAALVDANEDGMVSVGDAVETDAFPLTFDPVADFGEFTVKSAPVTSVTGFTPDSVQVTSTATVITWATGSVDAVQWFPAGGGPESALVDNTNALFEQTDIISINEGAALGAVPGDVQLFGVDQTDNAFLDISLDLP